MSSINIKWSRNYYDFKSFVETPLSRTFGENMRVFLGKYCQVEDYMVKTMWVWRTLLVAEGGGFVLPLYTIEERINNSVQESCDQCHRIGWTDHFASKKIYHFIVPIDTEWDEPLADNVLGRKTHILHGLIHCNGFGHLLCVNGIEGGSSFVCGKEVMALWDRICTSLRCREISLVDTSTKHGIDLQLLCGLSNRQTWFEEWGYRYSQGSSDVNKDTYDNALEEIRSLGPADCVNQEIINRYTARLTVTEFDSIGQLVSSMLNSLPTNQMDMGNDIIYEDLRGLCNDILSKSETAWTVLDSKTFTKEWPLNADHGLTFRVIPTESKNWVGGQLVVASDATIGDVKREVEMAMRYMYCRMNELKVTEILNLEGVDDYEEIFKIFEKLGLETEISVYVSGVDVLTTSDHLNYEGGANDESKVIKCKCGCIDGDGRWMVRCDMCKVWQHKLCNGWFDDPTKVLPFFLCNMCCHHEVFRIAEESSEEDE